MPIDILPEEWDPLGGLIPGFKTDRIGFPSSIECEEAVLGAILMDAAILEEAERLRPEHFYFERSQKLFATFRALANDGQPIDIRTVQAKLEREGQGYFDLCGGISYLACLDISLPDISRFGAYVDILIELHAKRQLVLVAATLAAEGKNGVRPREAIANALRSLEAVESASSRSDWLHINDVQDATLALLESENGCAEVYLPTGLPDLDNRFGGVPVGKIIYLAGRPGNGKTALAQQIAEHLACSMGIPAGIISLEMKAQELFLRSLCRRTGIEYLRMVKGGFSLSDWDLVKRANRDLRDAKLWIEETNMGVSEVVSKASKLRRKHGAKVIVLDYIGLLDTTDLRTKENRQLEVAEISRRLTAMAKAEDIAVIVLCQLSRAATARNRPQLQDLRDSGSQEQDAQMVWFVHRILGDRGVPERKAEIIVAKNRNGETGVVETDFDGPRMLFRCAAKGYPG